MFFTNETEKSPTTDSTSGTQLAFDSIEQFASCLDLELEELVNQFSEFETDKSVRKFFKRS